MEGMDMGSIQVNDKKTIEKFISDPDFPYLISFPRTGSHWLRMVMELYFETPSLVRIFYYKDADTFTCYHRHDEELDINRKNVIYLYRNPTDTIYSQLNYYKEAVDNKERIRHWSQLYGKHLSKWLVEENFTRKKTIVTYEGMKADMSREFKKVCDHFAVPFIPDKLKLAIETVSPGEVKQKTGHDPQVMNLTREYEDNREIFKQEYRNFILEIIHSQNQMMRKIFPDKPKS
jgi:hypothetical protein